MRSQIYSAFTNSTETATLESSHKWPSHNSGTIMNNTVISDYKKPPYQHIAEIKEMKTMFKLDLHTKI